MPFAEINKHRFHYTDTGGDGPALIFSHGFALDHTLFDAQVAAFKDKYRCIAWDERGHGMTNCLGDFTMWDSAEDVIGLMDHLGIKQATLVGLSQGGFLSMRAAVTHPDRVKALVLMDTAARSFAPEERAGYQQMRDFWCTEGPVGETCTIMAQTMYGPDTDQLLAKLTIARWRAKAPQYWAGGWSPLLDRDDFFDRLKDIKCPTLVIHGSEDIPFPLEVPREMAAAIPTCVGLEIIEGGPHACAATHPEEVNAALRPFLEKYA